jgi:hypothetical protein
MLISSSGTIGIGTTTPSASLHISSSQENGVIIESNSQLTGSAAVRITQTGTGSALVVEDSSNPDATAFVIRYDGRVGIGYANSIAGYANLVYPLNVNGTIFSSDYVATTGQTNTINPKDSVDFTLSTRPVDTTNINIKTGNAGGGATYTRMIVSGSGDVSILSGSLTVSGSVFATSSWATNALTASYVTGSIFTSANPALSSSYALTASYALSGLATSGSNVTASFASSTTWTFTHNLNNRYPVIQTLDSSFNQIIPQNIALTDNNTATITFPVAISGYAIASLGGANITQINNTASSVFATTGSNTFRGTQTFSGSLIPAGPYTNNTSSYDLGSATAAWKDLYVSNGSIKMISGSNSASMQFNGGAVTFTGAAVTLPSNSTVPTASYVTPYEGAWISYTPSWTAASVNPLIGNGSLQGWYKLVGKTCFVRGNIVMGSTTTFGTGEWYVSMPFTASHADAILMTANLLDNGTAWYNATLNGARAGFNYKTAIQYQVVGGTADSITPTAPFTWTNSDRFLWNGSYEIA